MNIICILKKWIYFGQQEGASALVSLDPSFSAELESVLLSEQSALAADLSPLLLPQPPQPALATEIDANNENRIRNRFFIINFYK